MMMRFIKIINESNAQVRTKLFGIYGLLGLFNIVAWSWAIVAFHAYPILLGSALLAYGFGLRHAVDADHITAIDNVTRKLMQQRSRPVGVGLFFSLGHSSVVFLATVGVAMTAKALQGHWAWLEQVGSVVGTTFSAGFLLALAMMNLVILRGIYRVWRRVRSGGDYVDQDFDQLLSNRGFFAQIFRYLFSMVGRSWHMYPIGIVFGLGFDTATEIGLLGMAAIQANKGLSPWAIMVLPALFSAAMSLVDTLDGHLMLGCYGWAYEKPIRKIYYNMTITAVSVLVAIVIGGIELLGLLSQHWSLKGPMWDAIESLNNNFGLLGYVIIAIFALSWIASVVIYRAKRLGDTRVN